MANNQYVNKVQYGGNTLIDLTSDTVAANKILSGYTAHDKSGAVITGTIISRDSNDLTVSTNINTTTNRTFLQISGLAGYYANAFTAEASEIYLPIPASNSSIFSVYIPNGTLNPSQSNAEDWIKLDIEVDSNGNSNVSDDALVATGVSF